LRLDSRQIQQNDLFLAINGVQVDGRKYIKNAVEQGAVAVLVEADKPNMPITFDGSIPLIPIAALKKHVSTIAARFYDFPSRKLHMLGVTGTNGKTSTTHFFAQIMTALGKRCGIIGTLGSGFYCELGEAGLTTPDPVSLQAILADFVRHQAQDIAMEVSSHSIDQGRINAVDFEIGVFTNLTQDHLDYHLTLDAYAAVKRRFLAEFNKTLIINADDAYGRQWAKELAQDKQVYIYATDAVNLPADLPSIYTENVRLQIDGVRATVHTPWGKGELHLPLIGRFNLSNALAVLTALCLRHIPLSVALAELAKLNPVAGRMQTASADGMPLIVVDYAHTPDALDKVLEALRAHTEKKLICVFGCGGDRDPGKRPLMAKAAEKWADQIILTNDNPRHENPQSIAEQVMQGFNHPDRVQIELDRTKAIQKSIQSAAMGDCVLIAGKGAERYQQIGDQQFPFDDMNEVRNYLDVGII
jgi:UDP-N-acetylmuramoyl-L-alanyl-D-glutamate--2,6-diaminopimelate ligase